MPKQRWAVYDADIVNLLETGEITETGAREMQSRRNWGGHNMSLFHPLDSAKDHLAENGITHLKGVGMFYWDGQGVAFRADAALNQDIRARQRKHGWTAKQIAPPLDKNP